MIGPALVLLAGAFASPSTEGAIPRENDEAGWGDDDGWDDDDDGWEDTSTPPATSDTTRRLPMDVQFGATLRSDAVFWLQRLSDDPVSSARHSIDPQLRFRGGPVTVQASIHAEFDLRPLVDDGTFPSSSKAAYAWQVAPRDAFVDIAPTSSSWIRLGRKVVTWGEGYVLSPLNRVNPPDLRRPGLDDPRDLLLPLTLLRAGVRRGRHDVEALWVTEAFYGYRSPIDGPYGSFDTILGDSPFASFFDDISLWWDHAQVGFAPSVWEGFARWRYFGEGFDTALYAATLRDDTGAYLLPATTEFLTQPPDLYIPLEHRRSTLLGHSGNALLARPLILRWELTVDLGQSYNTGDIHAAVPEVSIERGTLGQAMIGLEFSGIPRTRVLFEAQRGLFLHRPDALLYRWDDEILALRVSHHLLRERIHLNALGTLLGIDARNGWLVRLDGDLELADGIKLGFGVVLNGTTDTFGPLYGLDQHDRGFIRMITEL